MKTLIARTLLTLALLATVGLAVAASRPYTHTGVISQVEASANAVVIRQQIYILDKTVNIHGLPNTFPTVSNLSRGMSIGFNVVRNPKTPMRDALKILNKLPMNELRNLAKSGNVRTAIQQAARKKVIGS